jgi:amidase
VRIGCLERQLQLDFEIVEVEPPRVRECGDLGFRALMTESNALLKPDMERNGSHGINRIFANHLEVFPSFSGAQLLEVLAQRSAYVREWQLFLEDYPLVLTPFMLGPIHSWNRDAEDIAGASDVLGKGHYSFAINFLGLPAGIVAAGFEDGMPVGVQIVGRRFREDMIVSALETVEQKVGAAHQLLWPQIKAA